MKKIKKIQDIDELLKLVEHAGRDERRQQQIADMIEEMAAQEKNSYKRGWLLWTTRIAAAASIAGIILTTVHFIIAPSEPTGAIIANVPKHKTTTVAVSSYNNSTTHTTKQISNPSMTSNHKTKLPLSTDETDILYAETENVIDTMTEEETIIIEPREATDLIAENVSASEDSSVEQPTTNQPETDNQAEQRSLSKPAKRRGLFRLRRAEPSQMEGTSLPLFAFNI